ncbi:MAG: cation transporter dimerization domain-containing protein, partial [Chthoniobacteraceae bacterium]
CRTRKMCLEYYVDLHVEVDGEITFREGHLIAHAVKDAVLAAIPSVADVLVHVEPAGGYQPR